MKNANEPSDKLLMSYLTLRKSVGMLGLVLPAVLYLGCLIFYGCSSVGPSISQYYYSAFGDYFVGTLCAVAIFLFAYKGYDLHDRLLTNFAGVFALGVAFFPTHLVVACAACVINKTDGSNVSDTIHQVAASLFLISLGVMSIFQFTKTNGLKTPQKLARNKIYRICGYVMIGAVVLIGIYKVLAIPALKAYHLIFYLETLGLLAFGLSWLVKGEFILEDEGE